MNKLKKLWPQSLLTRNTNVAFDHEETMLQHYMITFDYYKA